MIEIVLLRRTLQNKFISYIEEGAGSGLGIRQILLLVIGKTFLIKNRNFAFVLPIVSLASSTAVAKHQDPPGNLLYIINVL